MNVGKIVPLTKEWLATPTRMKPNFTLCKLLHPKMEAL